MKTGVAPVEIVTIEAPVEEPSHAKLGIRELKDLLTAAGVSFAGATEKDDLVRLLSKARAQAAVNAGSFAATTEWQRVPAGVALPLGLEVKVDLRTGCNYARATRARPAK